MTVSDRWTEISICHCCALAGVASLSQGNGDIVVGSLPSGFRNVSSQYGDTFFCESCDRVASAHHIKSLAEIL
jgi:hypothetical protein